MKKNIIYLILLILPSIAYSSDAEPNLSKAQRQALASQTSSYAPIPNDCIIPDESEIQNRANMRRVSDFKIQYLPAGAGDFDTSAYMIGSVAVAIILPESTGISSSENWDASRENQVVSRILAGLNYLAAREPTANLTFTCTSYFGRIDDRAKTNYEPISRQPSDEGLWIGQIMGKFGYNELDTYRNKVFHFNNDLRTKYNTDWAYIIFVVDSLNDSDGEFPNSMFAYSYPGGPFVVMTYDNSSYGINNMDSVVAHESCHVFWALDEYLGASSGSEYAGYLNVINGNHAGDGITDITCLMRSGIISNVDLCSYSRGQVGWMDSNNNNILDSIDAPPASLLFCDTPSPTNKTSANFNGSGNVSIVQNKNPSYISSSNDITINTISNFRYRIDGSNWANATAFDGAFDSTSENYLFSLSNLLAGAHIIEAQAVDTAGGVSTPNRVDLTVNTSGTGNPPPVVSTEVVKSIKVYPNPCKVISSDTGISFKELPDKAKIRICTVMGELVFESAEISGGEYKWKLVNKNNEQVATEMYIYIISTKTKTVKTGKLIVVR